MPKKQDKVNIFLHEDVIDKLDILCEIKSTNKSELIREAVKLLLNNYRKDVAFEKADQITIKHIPIIIDQLKENNMDREVVDFKEAVLKEIDKLQGTLSAI